MATDLNQCQFIGRLGKDPETRFLPEGGAVANFSIACGWKTKTKDGTEWIRITAFGKLAEICSEYLKKGSQVFIQGRMVTRKWQDKEGQDRYTTEIIADRMQMLGSKPQGDGNQQERRPATTQPAGSKPAARTGGGASFDDMDDDIPF